ncbi:quinolinate synthase NadA [Methanoregula formicica]|uniref:Quinolinate synthase n=1 Tax=Methanoregula formicica (strain DSM 22288 / NBRC 105244 / SMSP) TaxID=593750 RepID=L0HDJ2_METFS|nr:quinolinate synthase NadA [Methanoregula formicica]AGB01861.1 quinolinate synthetase complex, A subunit [Methanoregula formicica SMSP]
MDRLAGSAEIGAEIQRLKEEQDAILLVHNYQPDEIQDIADITGDSLELSRAAATREEGVIVFCGVDFMAETAAILSPEKTVLLPAEDACCPMAQMISAPELRLAKERHPDAAVVCYVNTSAEVKAESNICCTSSNAVKVVNSVKEDEIIFVPDRNLGRYAQRFTKKKVMPWEGFCIVHDRITPSQVMAARKAHPDAVLLVHPECRPEVIDLADHVASTSGIIREVAASKKKEFIIGTEIGILYRLKKECPDKACFPLDEKGICRNMKKTDLKKVRDALLTLQPRVTVPDDVAARARGAIERMLALP